MPLAIDFGTSNTVAALWDAGTQDARSLPLADLTVARTDPHGREFHVVPSLARLPDPRAAGGLLLVEAICTHYTGHDIEVEEGARVMVEAESFELEG